MTLEDPATDDIAIPPRIQRMWGLDTSTRKGPRPGLSRDEIVAAAVAIADAEGLAAVSMSRVSQALGYTTMSLYRYVESKDELVSLMWDVGLTTSTEIDTSGGWRSTLEQWAFVQLRSLREHPWAVDIPINNPPLSPRQVEWMEIGLAALADTPLHSGEKLGVILTISVAALAEGRLTRELAQGDEMELRNYGLLIKKLVDPATHPNLVGLVDDGVFSIETEDPDEDFAFSLKLTLDGIEQLIQSRS